MLCPQLLLAFGQWLTEEILEKISSMFETQRLKHVRNSDEECVVHHNQQQQVDGSGW